MSNFDPFGQAIGTLFSLLVVTGILAPLGVWKLVEIIMWLYAHIDVSWQ